MAALASLASLAALALEAPAWAMPPGGAQRGLRDGANHHLGDDSFVAAFGREPGQDDPEALRMHTHLAFVHARLAATPAPSPDKEPMRARTLAALADYIARGVTPRNAHLPWRNPVFIDDDGRICAVGHLVAETAGRPLAEKIAREHRYDLIEDIARDVPEVAAWVAASGLTLDEVASIQPGYDMPIIAHYHPFEEDKEPLAEGPFATKGAEGETTGLVRDGYMEGEWARKDAAGHLVGTGTFHEGAGQWTSRYPDGARMAEGAYVDDKPEGAWRFFHPSGNLAAEGRFAHGYRDGRWRFFQDKAANVLLASGDFAAGRVSGGWKHFDTDGELVATSSDATPPQWQETSGGYVLEILPGANAERPGLHHSVHQGNMKGDHLRLDMLEDGAERLFVQFDSNDVYDQTGHRLVKDAATGAWRSGDCRWSHARLRAARGGDLVALHGLAPRSEPEGACHDATAKGVGSERGTHLDAMLASMKAVRSLSPDFVQKLALGERTLADLSPDEQVDDLAKVLAANMTWYVEWPHIDGRFIEVFHTLPGYVVRDL